MVFGQSCTEVMHWNWNFYLYSNVTTWYWCKMDLSLYSGIFWSIYTKFGMCEPRLGLGVLATSSYMFSSRDIAIYETFQNAGSQSLKKAIFACNFWNLLIYILTNFLRIFHLSRTEMTAQTIFDGVWEGHKWSTEVWDSWFWVTYILLPVDCDLPGT